MRQEKRMARGDAGAAAVEFALLFPIFMILALGTIAAGVAFSKQINVTQAAREASRFGATYDIPSIVPVAPATKMDTWLNKVDQAVQQSAGSANDPIGGYDYRCVAYVATTSPIPPAVPAIDTTRSRHKVDGGTTTNGQCPGTLSGAVTSIGGTDYTQVVIARNSDFFVLFINPTLRLDSLSLTPYEGKAP